MPTEPSNETLGNKGNKYIYCPKLKIKIEGEEPITWEPDNIELASKIRTLLMNHGLRGFVVTECEPLDNVCQTHHSR